MKAVAPAVQALRLHRHPALLRRYGWLPHDLLDGAVAAATSARLPGPLRRALIAAWVARGGIDLTEVEVEDWPTVEAFFLRRLRPEARPIAAGLVSPVDGFVVCAGEVSADVALPIKGQRLSLDALLRVAAPTASPVGAAWRRLRGQVGAEHRAVSPVAAAEVEALRGGWQLTVFLTPDGYHHVHCPFDAELVEVGWLPGRTFPQNDDALRVAGPSYARNERAVLRLRHAAGFDAWLVMVAASLVGGIDIDGLARADWMRSTPLAVGRRLHRGERLGCFRFGSTVVLALPPAALGPEPGWQPAAFGAGAQLRLGQALLAPADRAL